MRNYELTVILKGEDVKKITDLLKKLKANVVATEPSVNRKFAYPIKKLTEGYYAFFELEMDPAVVLDLDKALRLDENVIRHLIIAKLTKNQDSKASVQTSKPKVTKKPKK